MCNQKRKDGQTIEERPVVWSRWLTLRNVITNLEKKSQYQTMMTSTDCGPIDASWTGFRHLDPGSLSILS